MLDVGFWMLVENGRICCVGVMRTGDLDLGHCISGVGTTRWIAVSGSGGWLDGVALGSAVAMLLIFLPGRSGTCPTGCWECKANAGWRRVRRRWSSWRAREEVRCTR